MEITINENQFKTGTAIWAKINDDTNSIDELRLAEWKGRDTPREVNHTWRPVGGGWVTPDIFWAIQGKGDVVIEIESNLDWRLK